MVHVGGGVFEIAQRGGGELVPIRRAVAQADSVEPIVGEHGAVVAESVFCFLEDLHPMLLGGCHGGFSTPHEAVERRVGPTGTMSASSCGSQAFTKQKNFAW